MNRLFAMMFPLFVLGVPALAFAQDAAAAAPPTIDQGLSLVPAIVDAARGGNWSIFASLLIMVLVWLVTKAPMLSDLIKDDAKAWVAAVAGVLTAVAAEAFTSGNWGMAILHGITTGAGAVGFWELVGKKIPGAKPKA